MSYVDTGIKCKNLVCVPGPNNWEPVSAQYANDHIFEDWEHLYGLGREMDLVSKAKTGRVPGDGPGPRNCGRVACTSNTVIWWCNDTRPPLLFPVSYNEHRVRITSS